MPASSMCSMMPPISTSSSVAERIDVDFDGVFEEAVDQDGPVRREDDGLLHVAAHGLLVVGDDHGAAAEHVAGPHQHGVAEPARDVAGFVDDWWRCRWAGDGMFELVEQLAEELAVFGEIDVLGIGADDGHAGALSAAGPD